MPNAGRREKGPKCGSLPLNAGELAALDVHDSSLLPSLFVDRLHLHQCAFCDKWFSKLAQHKSRCPKRQVRSESASHANGSRDAHRAAVTKIIDNVPIQALSNNWSKIDAESEICQTHPEVPPTLTRIKLGLSYGTCLLRVSFVAIFPQSHVMPHHL